MKKQANSSELHTFNKILLYFQQRLKDLHGFQISVKIRMIIN